MNIFGCMINNIIFDFGGVILNIDFQKSIDAFEALGFTNFDELFSQFKADELFMKLEVGRVNEDDFFERLKEVAPEKVEKYQLKNAWNAMLLSYRKESLEFLNELSRQYNLYLLSNTNEIHYAAFSEMLRRETKFDNLESFFTKAFYSHELKMRKPDKEIYEYVIRDARINPEETLFIDDTHTNFDEAEKLGIKTYLLLPDERIEMLTLERFS